MTASRKSLTHKTARGVVWVMAQTVSVKLVSTIGQIILAWLLLKEDWGLVALAYTVTTFTDLIYQAGIREVLIQRQKNFARWATPAFWMSLTFGLVGMLVTIGLAPAASWLYFDDPASDAAQTLTWLILILALAALVIAASNLIGWYNYGFGWIQETLSPFNVWYYLTVIIALAPGMGLRMGGEKLLEMADSEIEPS